MKIMKKILLALILGLLLIGFNMYAADGDLIVNGKIGVGTTTPISLLHIVNTDASGQRGFNNDQINDSGAAPVFNNRKARGTPNLPLAVQSGDVLSNISSSGYNGTGWSTGVRMRAFADTWNSSTYGSRLVFETISSGTTTIAERMRIASDGNIAIGSTSTGGYKLYVNGSIYGTSYSGSDIRLKDNIKPISNALALVQGLQGVSFNWKTAEYQDKNLDKGKQIGLIAQDVEKVLPEIVKTDAEGYKAIAYEKLTAVLVEALKEQQKEIQTLKAEVQKLKNKRQN
jgi:hypothetical protein